MTDPVIKKPNCPIDNRLSAQQVDVLTFLARSIGQQFGPKIGEIVDGVGRRRDKAGFASISRTVNRLRSVGLVAGYTNGFRQRGDGLFWELTDEGRQVVSRLLPEWPEITVNGS